MANKHAEDADEIVLSYHDSLLRSSDVNRLKGPHWINDAVIGFYYEYLTQKCQTDGEARLLFVSPPLTQLLRFTDSRTYDAFLDAVDAKGHDFVFFPLNDCDSRVDASGTHWTLLVYSRASEACYHYDSIQGAARMVAYDFAKNLIKYFVGADISTTDKRYREMCCPQQDNGYDCGLYVICLTELISRHIMKGYEIKDCDYRAIPEIVEHKRSQLLNLVDTLRMQSSKNE